MTFGSYLENAFRILTFDANAAKSIRDDEGSFRYSMIVLGVLGVLWGLWIGFAMLPMMGEAGAVVGFIIGVLGIYAGAFISYGIFHLLAKAFGGTASFRSYVATAVALSLVLIVVQIGVTIIALIPVLGWLVALAYWIYTIVVNIFLIREVHELSTGRAAAVYLIPVVVVFILFIVLMIIGFSLLLPAGVPVA